MAPGADLEARAEAFDAGAEEFGADYTEITIDESPPQPAAPVSRRRAGRRPKVRSDDLEARVAAESVLAREDLRRIGIISVTLLVGLAVAWVLFVVLDVFQLY